MQIEEFKKRGHQLIDWIGQYYEELEKFPVKSQVKPGDIYNQIPNKGPEKAD